MREGSGPDENEDESGGRDRRGAWVMWGKRDKGRGWVGRWEQGYKSGAMGCQRDRNRGGDNRKSMEKVRGREDGG